MTLEKFVASRNIRCGMMFAEYVYCDTLIIEHRGDNEFGLTIANCQYSGTLAEMEEILYKWADDEGYFDD